MPFNEIKILSLSFRNIQRIENLEGLTCLTKLNLDNNGIKRIENLDHLSNLQVLDLSFNGIARIEGLENLTQLTDLSLFHNKIEEIGNGLDNLKNLNVLSLGDNNIQRKDEVKRLRQFKDLRLVNLGCNPPCNECNPICKETDYRHFVLAYIKNLKYLDYRLVSDKEMEETRETHQDEINTLEAQEQSEEEEMRKIDEETARKKYMESINMDGVAELFDRLINENPVRNRLNPNSVFLSPILPLAWCGWCFGCGQEYPKLSEVPTLMDDFNKDGKYKETYDDMVKELRKDVSALHDKKQEEQKEFTDATKAVIEEKDEVARQLVSDFREKLSEQAGEVHSKGKSKEVAKRELEEMNDTLKDDLMNIEVELVEVVGRQVNEFKLNYTDLADQHNTRLYNFFTALRAEEYKYTNALEEREEQVLHEYGGENTDTELSQDAQALLSDKDTLHDSIANFKDTRMAIIDGLEDSLKAEENSRCKQITSDADAWGHRRNRHRVSEISALYSHLISDIDAVLNASSDSTVLL